MAYAAPFFFSDQELRHPPSILHFGERFSLEHLAPGEKRIEWTAKSGPMQLRFSVGYSDHCYTDSQLPIAEGCGLSSTKGGVRVFCPRRHAGSLAVPGIIDGLFRKPSTTVGVIERNFNVFRIEREGSFHYVFFNVRRLQPSDHRADMRLFVESAYFKTAHVRARRKMPFGRLVEAIHSGERY